jgi:signal peptidase I
MCPGWGHLYAGAYPRAIGALVLANLLLPGIAWGWVEFARSPTTHLLTAAWTLGALLAIPLDAALTARRLPPLRGRSSRRLLLHLLWVPVVVGSLGAEMAWMRRNLVQLYRTPTESMVPSLLPGDIFFVDVRAQTKRELRLGDIIVFERPGNGGVFYAKRIVGLPSNQVAIRGGRLEVDGRFRTSATNDGPRLHLRSEQLGGSLYFVEAGASHQIPDFGPVEVLPEHLFVLGDARPHSEDSRRFGSIPREAVSGRVLHILWSWDPRRRGVRWERLGTSPRGSEKASTGGAQPRQASRASGSGIR